MIDVLKMRSLYESCIGPRDNPRPYGRTQFVHKMRNWLGLSDLNGNDYKDRIGNRILRESQVDASEFSLQELAMATLGDRWTDFFNPAKKQQLHQLGKYNALLEGQYHGDPRALLENVGVGVDVSTFADINAWTATTGGLIERKILEAFYNPDYIGDEIMASENTKIADGQKVIGVSRLGDKAAERQPGEPHVRTQLLERWVQLGKTRENALAVDVLKEAAFFDLTGQLLEHAGQHGDWIRYRKEIDQLSTFIGVTGYSSATTDKWAFNYKGNKYAIYTATALAQTNSATNMGYVSQLTGNDLADWKSVESAWLIFQRNTDPETGTRVLIKPDTIIVNPARVATAKIVFGATETERRTANTQGSGTGQAQATTGDLHVARLPGNVVDVFGGGQKVLWSPLLEMLHTNSTTDATAPGLALSQSNANQYWYWLQRGRAMKYMVNWPLTLVQVPATNYDMVDRGVVASFFGDERGMPSWWSPWHVLQNTN